MHGNTKLSQLNKLADARSMVEAYEKLGNAEMADWWRAKYAEIFRRVYR